MFSQIEYINFGDIGKYIDIALLIFTIIYILDFVITGSLTSMFISFLNFWLISFSFRRNDV